METRYPHSRGISGSRRASITLALLCLPLCLLPSACTSTTTTVHQNVTGGDGFDSATDRPATPKTLYTMARILAGQRRDSEAEFILVRIIHEDPGYIPAYAALADLNIRNHKLDAAVKVLYAGLVKSPDDAVLLNNLGMCRVGRGDYTGALVFFNRAALSDPVTPKYAANRAMALGMLGRYDESLVAYNPVVTPADAHYNLAVLCEARGDRERATAEFTTAETLRAAAEHPSDHPAEHPQVSKTKPPSDLPQAAATTNPSPANPAPAAPVPEAPAQSTVQSDHPAPPAVITNPVIAPVTSKDQ